MAGIDVDGARPAVEWVTSLPRAWRVNEGERLVLLALACDSFDGLDTYPGRTNLAEWTGMLASSVGEILSRLERSTEHRPALIRRESGKGGRGRRARVMLLQPSVKPAAVTDQFLDREPSGDTDEFRGLEGDGKPAAKRAAKPTGDTGTTLPLPFPSSPARRPTRRTSSRPGTVEDFGPSRRVADW